MVLEFEKPIADLEQKLQEMKDLAKGRNIDLTSDIESLEDKILALKKKRLSKTSPAGSESSSPDMQTDPMLWITFTRLPTILLSYMVTEV